MTLKLISEDEEMTSHPDDIDSDLLLSDVLLSSDNSIYNNWMVYCELKVFDLI